MSAIAMQAFYAPALPITVPITVLGLIGNYWTEKYTFLRWMVMPPSLGSKVQEEMSDFFELIPFFYLFGNFLFYFTLTDDNGETIIGRVPIFASLGALFVVLVSFLVPFKKIVRYIIPKRIDPRKKLTYNEVKSTFITDYERENPLTKRRSLRVLTMSQKKENIDIDLEISQNPNELDIDFRRQSVIKPIEEDFEEDFNDEDMEAVEEYARNCPNSLLEDEIVDVIFSLRNKLSSGGFSGPKDFEMTNVKKSSLG
jgi:hypothetical protein